jgi:hypothetical protein
MFSLISVNKIVNRKFYAVALFVLPSFGFSAVLELEESKLHGKKDQPEAMTFISRSPLDVGGRSYKVNLIDRIKDATKSEVFNVRVEK